MPPELKGLETVQIAWTLDGVNSIDGIFVEIFMFLKDWKIAQTTIL